jgi:hypothetical protein
MQLIALARIQIEGTISPCGDRQGGDKTSARRKVVLQLEFPNGQLGKK